MKPDTQDIPPIQPREWDMTRELIIACRSPARLAKIRLNDILSRYQIADVDYPVVSTYLHALLLDELMNEREAAKTRAEVADLATLIDSRWRKATGAQSADLVWRLNFCLGYDKTPPQQSLWKLMTWPAAALNALYAIRRERWDDQRRQERLKYILGKLRDAAGPHQVLLNRVGTVVDQSDRFQLREWQVASQLIQAARPPARLARAKLNHIFSHNPFRDVDYAVVDTFLTALLCDELRDDHGAFRTPEEISSLAALIDPRWRETTAAPSSRLMSLLNNIAGHDDTPEDTHSGWNTTALVAAALNAFGAARHEPWDDQRKQQRVMDLLPESEDALNDSGRPSAPAPAETNSKNADPAIGQKKRELPGFQLKEWQVTAQLINACRSPVRLAKARLKDVFARYPIEDVDYVVVNTMLCVLLDDELMTEHGVFKTREEVAELAALIDSRWRKTTGMKSPDLSRLLNSCCGYSKMPYRPKSPLWDMIVWPAAAVNALATHRHEQWDDQYKQERFKYLHGKFQDALDARAPDNPKSGSARPENRG